MKDVGRKKVVLVGCVVLMFASCVLAQNWPQWRGPNRDGKLSGFTAPQQWPAELTQKWRATVGYGDATPALVGDKLYVSARQGEEEVTICLNAADGKELWKEVIEKDLEGVMVKDPSSIYEIGGRSTVNIKLKNYKTAVIVVEQVEPNSKGTKVFGTANLKDGQRIPDVECQLAGVFDIPLGAEMPIRYLDIYKGRLIQAHKLTSSNHS